MVSQGEGDFRIIINTSYVYYKTFQISDAYPDVIAMKSRNIVTEEWSTWSYKKLATEVQNVSKALIETGLHRHHCVVIIGLSNCPLWVISHLAAISAG